MYAVYDKYSLSERLGLMSLSWAEFNVCAHDYVKTLASIGMILWHSLCKFKSSAEFVDGTYPIQNGGSGGHFVAKIMHKNS